MGIVTLVCAGIIAVLVLAALIVDHRRPKIGPRPDRNDPYASAYVTPGLDGSFGDDGGGYSGDGGGGDGGGRVMLAQGVPPSSVGNSARAVRSGRSRPGGPRVV